MWYSFRPTDGGEWNRILGLPCSNYQSASYRGSFDQVWDRSLASKADEAQPASPLARGRETQIQVGSNLGPNTAKLGPKPCTMTQNKARRTNKIDFLQLPWAQEVPSSNLGAPTKLLQFSDIRGSCGVPHIPAVGKRRTGERPPCMVPFNGRMNRKTFAASNPHSLLFCRSTTPILG